MTRPTLLLISPKFHGYWQSARDAFERRGYTVTTHIYDAEQLPGRIQRKVFRELPARIGVPPWREARRTTAAIAALRRLPDAVVVIMKGDCFAAEFWSEVSDRNRTVLWLYDELRRTTHRPETLRSVDAVASYSRADVSRLRNDGLEAREVPLAFDHTIEFEQTSAVPGVAFVGARYPTREDLLRRLMGAGVPVRAFGRDWSDNVVDRLRTWRARPIGIPNGRDIGRAAAYGVMASAHATLNVHFNQDGFTMRTFEAAGVGAVQLIDRPDVSELYEPDREIAVFESPGEAVELAHRAQRDSVWANRIRGNGRKRTLAEHTFDHRIAELEKLWL